MCHSAVLTVPSSWKSQVKADPTSPLFPLAESYFSGKFPSDQQIKCEGLLELTQGQGGLVCPVVTEELVSLYLEYYIQKGFINRPE
jgi:hypothetical protein